MPKHGLMAVAAGALAAAIFATVPAGTEAMAAAPKCLNKANKHVACTDKLKAKAPRKKATNYGKVDMDYRPPPKPKGREDCMSCSD